MRHEFQVAKMMVVIALAVVVVVCSAIVPLLDGRETETLALEPSKDKTLDQ